MSLGFGFSLPAWQTLAASGGAGAVLNLDFAGSSTLSPLLSYTSRGSNAMQYDSQGRLVWAPANMLAASQNITDTLNWTYSLNITAALAGALAPDGTASGNLLTETAISGGHALGQSTVFVAGQTYTFSVYAKPAGRDWIILEFNGLGSYACFNVTTGVVGTTSGSPNSASITSVGNGWYRCTITKTAGVGGASVQRIYLASADNTSSYLGVVGTGVYLWGAQLELRGIDSPKPYNATTSAAYYAPRLDYDPGTLQPKGLFLEEAGTNLLTWSTNLDTATGGWTNTDTTVSTSSVIGPDGFPCQLLTEGVAGTSIHTKSATVTAATDFFCYSVYAKRGNTDWLRLDVIDGSSNGAEAWYNLALGTTGALNLLGTGTATANYIEPVGNGWYRCIIIGKAVVGTSLTARSCNTSANNTTTRVSNATRYEFGPQLESVSGAATRWASSYIPTYGATATRNADNTPYMAVGSWFNATAGTVVCEYSQPPTPNGGITPPLWSFTTDSNNVIYGYTYPQGQVCGSGIYIRTGGTQLASNNTSISSPYWGCKAAVAFASSDYAVYNGVGASVTTAGVAGSLPTVATMTIGSSYAVSTAQTSRWIKSFQYYAQRLPNATLQSLADLTATPQVDLGFLSYGLNQGLLDRRLTWTDRASNATMFDSQGRLVYAPANMLAASQDFSNAFWTKAAILSTSGAAVAPDGTPTAQLVVPDTTNAQHYMTQNSVSYGVTMFSVYAKAGGYSWLGMAGAQNGAFTTFDLQNGVIGSVGTNTQATITAVGNGWYRCTVAQAYVGQVNYLFIEPNNSQATWTPNGTSGIYLWGAQYEQVGVDSPKPYLSTETAARYQPRIDYDPATGTCLGLLLEEARTNLLTYSEDFSNVAWTKYANTGISYNVSSTPDGMQKATLIYATLSGTSGVYQQPTTGTYVVTTSVFAKAAGMSWLHIVGGAGSSPTGVWFDLSAGVVGTQTSGHTGTIQSIGKGWYRCSVTHPSLLNPFIDIRLADADNVTTVTPNGIAGIYIYSAQLEVGAFPTSYIPTYGATATRNADYAPYMPLPYSPNGSLGTLVSNALARQLATQSAVAALGDGTSANYIYHNINSAGNFNTRSAVASVGGNSAANTANAISVSTNFRAASMQTGTPNIKLVLNGGTVVTTTQTNNYPANSTVAFVGYFLLSVSFGQKWISRARRYHNFAFSDAQLQALTT